MTDKQKQALRVLERLLDVNGEPIITKNEWLLLFDFVIGNVESITLTIPKDLKGTDTDGGVVGEKGEQGEPETLEEKVEHWQRMHDIAMEKIKETFKEEDSPETKAIKEYMENLKKRIEDNQLGCIVQRLDKIIELLQSAILILPKEPYVPPIIYKRPLDPDPNVLGGWTTTASTFGSDYDIDTDKIK